MLCNVDLNANTFWPRGLCVDRNNFFPFKRRNEMQNIGFWSAFLWKSTHCIKLSSRFWQYQLCFDDSWFLSSQWCLEEKEKEVRGPVTWIRRKISVIPLQERQGILWEISAATCRQNKHIPLQLTTDPIICNITAISGNECNDSCCCPKALFLFLNE